MSLWGHLEDRYATERPRKLLALDGGGNVVVLVLGLGIGVAIGRHIENGQGRFAYSGVQFTLEDGKRVVWGSADSSELKANVLVALLSQPGRTYDVSSPDLPTIR